MTDKGKGNVVEIALGSLPLLLLVCSNNDTMLFIKQLV